MCSHCGARPEENRKEDYDALLGIEEGNKFRVQRAMISNEFE
jgi:hypothetical protein